MPTSMCEVAEPIAGYVLRERIGAGGYGEVWKAEAPGGLHKAVKIVFGCLGEERANTELKSLNRIREVRHPFVLSLERIEVIDGRLIIVSELADASLKDRFQECREAGLPGIRAKNCWPVWATRRKHWTISAAISRCSIWMSNPRTCSSWAGTSRWPILGSSRACSRPRFRSWEG